MVTGPGPSGALPVRSEANPPPDARSPVGAGLLRYYGCVTCHELAIPPFRGRWGPDLDTIGSKTTADWLDGYLADPRAARSDSRMPLVPMEDSTRTIIVSFLAGQRAALPDMPPSAGHDGASLYTMADCRACHRLDGDGGDRGPSLDGVASRVRPAWLFAYLMDPSDMIRNTRMPLFAWEEEQAADLARYLVGEGPSDTNLPTGGVDREDGLEAMAQHGCFQCHRIGAYVRPLTPSGDRTRFAGYHATESATFSIALRDAETAAMAEALDVSPLPTMSDSAFLAAFWKTPIALQGSAPAAHDSLASHDHPDGCRACHVTQYEEWQESLHAGAMGPGVIGQLVDHAYDNPAYVAGCQDCHAPNAEQYASLPGDHGYGVNYEFDVGLRDRGVTCVACHVRGHARFGPAPTERPPASAWRGPGHGGAHETTAFSNAAFCSTCHQFESDGRSLKGKLLQDTYNEWRASPHAAAGETCQSCHMPGRSHRWLGVHDSATVVSAIEVDVAHDFGEAGLEARVEVRNVGAGHHLPTYVTPKLFVDVVQVTDAGRAIPYTRQTRAIGREIDLGEHGREIYDTRIPAGGSWRWAYAGKRAGQAASVIVTIEAYPDHFYARFFEGYDRTGLSDTARLAIEEATRGAAASRFIVYRRTIPFIPRQDTR